MAKRPTYNELVVENRQLRDRLATVFAVAELRRQDYIVLSERLADVLALCEYHKYDSRLVEKFRAAAQGGGRG